MHIKRLSLLGLLLLAGAGGPLAQAQPSSTGPAPQASPTAIPLDGGASLLLAAGGAYGLRRLRQRRRALR